MKSVLQIPISTALRDKATNVAADQGFSSLQEAVRVFLTQLSQEKILISFTAASTLSRTAAERLENIDDDVFVGKNTSTAHSVDDLMEQLNAD